MSEHIEGKSLASLVSLKGAGRRDDPDSKTRLSVANSTRRSSFEGFLNTFLGRDAGTEKAKRSGPGSGLKPADRESLEKSMDKTTTGGEASGGDVDGDVAAAAEEAAVLIWNLLSSCGDGEAIAGSVPDSLRKLANSLNARNDALIAIESANASAEMNSAAILASVDELLEGMPRHVLDEALSRMAGQLGLPAQGGFEGVLAMLRGQVVGVNTVSKANLLGMLSASANPAFSAENAAGPDADGALGDLFDDFLSEKKEQFSRYESVEEVADGFAAWLRETGKSNLMKGLAADGGRQLDQLVANVLGNSNQKNQAFSDIFRTLENALQSNRMTDGADEEFSGGGGNGREAQTAAPVQPAGQHPGQHPGAAANTQNVPVSSMLEQMENIERLSEAMRMAAKGGVNNITMQLAPAELGRVMLRVQSRNGVVSARLKVERREAAEQLGGGLGQLRESLRALGIELGEVEIVHQSPGGMLAELSDPDGRGGSGEGGGGEGRPAPRSSGAVPDGEETPPAGDDGPLNLFA